MKVQTLLLSLLMILALSGCRKPLSHPEVMDPVYRDLRFEASKVFSQYKEKEKAATEAKKAYEAAPIRTGLRLSSQELYFKTLHEQEVLAQKYRYLSLKAELQKKADALKYPQYFAEKKPWPDLDLYKAYETEKRLNNAPKEWDPDRRIKERALASVPKAPAPEQSEHE